MHWTAFPLHSIAGGEFFVSPPNNFNLEGEKNDMATVQQEETLHYFKTHAQDWQNKAKPSDENKFNIIKQRNGYVVEVIKDREETRLVLDIGCGTGDLVCEIAKAGIKAIGVDFSQDMVELALKKAITEQLGNAHFECCSIFDFDFSKQKFDVISANGFIEYISQNELNDLFNFAYEALAHNGSLVVSSRNRLFNIFSLNAYTQHEITESAVEGLLEEAIALASGESLEDLSKRKPISFQKVDTKHANTGIDVTTRYQYTPLQLITLLKDKGFNAVEIYPIHIHCAPPVFTNKHPEIHGAISNLLQTYGRQSLELVPFSSSFMLHVQRNG